ncbi:MAG: amidase [Acidimicrobiia bacterium]
MDDDLAFASALEQRELVRQREVSPSDLVELYLERIERLNPQLDAFLTVAGDQARDAARLAEKELAAAGDGADLPPFLGVPISIKDLNDTAGIRTTHGTAEWHDRVPDRDEEVVARIRRAGFIILGKTNTPEFGARAVTQTLAYPPGRNPWDTSRTPGGSSGGAGAAVAAGLGAVAQGSDGGGSIRVPSAWCGVFGIKPSRGRVSSAPGPQSWNATNGPIARTVEDAAALLDVMAGPAVGDVWQLASPEHPFAEDARQAPARLRVAWTTKPVDPDTVVAPAWREAVTATLSLLEEQGHEIMEVELPQLDVTMLALVPASATAARLDLPPTETLDTTNQTLLAYAAGMSAKDLMVAENEIQRVTRTFAEWFEGFDVLLTPTMTAPPPPVGEAAMGDEDFAGMLELMKLVAFTPMANMTGQPAVAVPAGLDDAGLPVSVQVVGRPLAEATIIRVAAQLEAARPWRHLRPPVS